MKKFLSLLLGMFIIWGSFPIYAVDTKTAYYKIVMGACLLPGSLWMMYDDVGVLKREKSFGVSAYNTAYLCKNVGMAMMALWFIYGGIKDLRKLKRRRINSLRIRAEY